MTNKYTIAATLSAIALASGGFAIFQAHANSQQKTAAQAPQAPVVETAKIVNRNIIDWQNFSGRIEAVDRVEIRPQVSGVLVAVNFKDGTLVKKGDVLFTIDPRPFAAEVARAEAQLAATQARLSYTSSDVARGERLMADNAIAKRDYEEKQNASREAIASVKGAEAAVRIAKLNLEYTQIKAPIDGRMSRAEVTIGNLVAANPTVPLTTLVSSSKVYASFDVDEQTFLKYVNPTLQAKNQSIPVHLGLANEDGYSRQGVINSVDNRLDISSGTIRVRALFNNPDGQLVPGLYARVKLGSGGQRNALLIDERAVGTDQDKRFVLVVDDHNKTAYREVKLGTSLEGMRIVDSGLKAGETIVVNGLQRVRPGDTVSPKQVNMSSGKAVAEKSNNTSAAL
jgi:multidrug efflux system membrane fusion protein